MEQKKSAPVIRVLRVILVLSILVLFPLISFVFLWEGVTDRKAELDRMGDFGVLASTSYLLIDSTELHADSMLNSVVVVSASGAFNTLIEGRVDSLLHQFGPSEDFLLLALYDDSSAEEWRTYTMGSDWNGSALVAAKLPVNLVEAGSLLEAEGCRSGDCPYFLLIDRSGQVRRLVDPADRTSMVSLVKQIAILIAKPRTFEKPEVIREQEK